MIFTTNRWSNFINGNNKFKGVKIMTNTLKIKNFGPILNADITVSPLTIFLGPNSSGKSFSAGVIHSVLEASHDAFYIKNRFLKLFSENNDELFRQFKNGLDAYADLKPKLSDKPFKFSFDKLKSILSQCLDVYTRLLENRLKDNFANNLNSLNRLNKYPFKFLLEDMSLSIIQAV